MEYKSCIYDFYSFLANPDLSEEEIDRAFRDSAFRSMFLKDVSQKDEDEILLRISNNLFKLERNIVAYAIERNKEITSKIYYEVGARYDKEKRTEVESRQMTFSAPEIAELAKRFKVKGKTTTNTIYAHLKSGVLPSEQDAMGKWVVKREDVEKYLGRKDF